MNSKNVFPEKTAGSIKTPALLKERGFSLRYANAGDMPGLRTLYADTRSEEMSAVPWPALAKQQFLDQQFDLQHQHYLKYYPDADFLVIERDAAVQGRYYISRTAPEHLIVDICLMAQQRGHGVGRVLIEESQREAAALGRGMHLHVIKYNFRAQRLYEKLGFRMMDDGSDMHLHMRWRDNPDAA